MTRKYEVVYIFDSTLDEAQVNERLQRFHALLPPSTDGESGIASLEHWGKRTLAYPIKRRDTGYYVVAKVTTNPTALPEFERAIRLDESVLRHLVVIDEGATPAAVKVDDDVADDIRGEDLDE
ncbi:MAG TPA: 30S ribosomal protein S6 [Gemmatimonadales bacterium]|nr:30S ribosomal protein S6 [Gemmatimonadales bacterium]